MSKYFIFCSTTVYTVILLTIYCIHCPHLPKNCFSVTIHAITVKPPELNESKLISKTFLTNQIYFK